MGVFLSPTISRQSGQQAPLAASRDSQGRPQSHPSQSERQRRAGDDLRSHSVDLENLAEACPHILVVTFSKRSCEFWLDRPSTNNWLWERRSFGATTKLPARLGWPPQKLLMLNCLLLQLRQDVTGVAHGDQDPRPLLGLEQLWIISPQLHTTRFPFPKRQCVLGFSSWAFQILVFPWCKALCRCSPNAARASLVLSERMLTWTSSKNAMSRSPSRKAALAATRARCCPELKKHGHDGVPFFAAVTPEDVHVLAHLIFPQISRRSGTEQADERDQLFSMWHVRHTLEDCGPGDVVERTHSVH